jgi:putative sigma-54 modulation protein
MRSRREELNTNQTLQIKFRGLQRSEALETDIREKIDKLNHLCRDIAECTVTVESPHHHQHQGHLHHVRIVLRARGKEIIVNPEHAGAHAHEDPFVAIHHAFAAAERQIRDAERGPRAIDRRHSDAETVP